VTLVFAKAPKPRVATSQMCMMMMSVMMMTSKPETEEMLTEGNICYRWEETYSIIYTCR